MTGFDKILAGGDLRSIGKSDSVVFKVNNQKDFDELFTCLFHADRLVVMRAADTIEKITLSNPQYLKKHNPAIIKLANTSTNKELIWHLALLIPRLPLKGGEFSNAWSLLTRWARNKENSRIVRVNAMQGLFEMLKQKNEWEHEFYQLLTDLEKENIPSINARIRKIRNGGRLS